MKKVAAVGLVLLFASSSAFAGVVSFNPSSTMGDSSFFEVTVTGDSLTAFDTVDLVFGTPTAGLELTGFSWDGGFSRTIDTILPDVVFAGSGYMDTLQIGFIDFGGANAASPLLLGILEVSTAGLVAPAAGDIAYTIVVDTSRESPPTSTVGNGATTEPLLGSITIPEPATLALLGLAAVGLIRRRRKTA